MRKLETPYFIISKEKLDENIRAFTDALQTYWPNSVLAYSVKTNSLPWVLRQFLAKGAYAEAVSAEEYKLARLTGFPADRIVLNGPVKTEACFRAACAGGSIVNLDSAKDLALLKRYASDNTRIGIRVNVDPMMLPEEGASYAREGMRFGFCEATGGLQQALDAAEAVTKGRKAGLHLHCSSKTRTVEVFRTLCRYAAELIRKYRLEPAFIDIGGGFFGGLPGKPTAQQYIAAIEEELRGVTDRSRTALVIEPGASVIGSVADYHASVVDVKELPRARIVTTDASRLHIDPLWAKTGYMFTINRKHETPAAAHQVICGYTCMEADRLFRLENEPALSVGDEIVFHCVGPYTMTLGGMFIRFLPEVYAQTGGSIERIRRRISVEEYINLQSVPEDSPSGRMD